MAAIIVCFCRKLQFQNFTIILIEYAILSDNKENQKQGRAFADCRLVFAVTQSVIQANSSKTAFGTLLFATWNIREFGDNRRAESLHYIAEIIS
jgi:hypothetical protein